MKFSDLLHLPFDARTNIISVEAILDALPATPAAVASQFYADHGRKSDHQRAYGALQLEALSWSLMPVDASSLIAASTLPDFQNWVTNVSERAALFATGGWKSIDTRREVQQHWAERGTWLVPPVVLAGSLVSSTSAFHVAEGHTRMGLLRGLVTRGVLASSSMHEVWVGSTA